jgi:lactate dehydrogenase-like 2-hydroxyacid dehydrogenase
VQRSSIPIEKQMASVDVLIPTVAKVDAALLKAAPQLQLIVQPAAGYQNIDVEAARCVCLPPSRASTPQGARRVT